MRAAPAVSRVSECKLSLGAGWGEGLPDNRCRTNLRSTRHSGGCGKMSLRAQRSNLLRDKHGDCFVVSLLTMTGSMIRFLSFPGRAWECTPGGSASPSGGRHVRKQRGFLYENGCRAKSTEFRH